MFGSSNRKTWREEAARLLESNEKLSDRLAEFQIQIEVMGEVLEQKDQRMMEFIDQLHNTMGGERAPTCEAEALNDLRMIRARSDMYVAIREVLAGRFSPDQAILRRIAGAVGTSQLDIESVVNRAGQLSQVHSENAGLRRDLVLAKQEIDDLEDDCD